MSAKAFLKIGLGVFLATAASAQAEVYRCEGPDGPVYTDRACGPEVMIEDSNSGLGGQVSGAVFFDLQARRAERSRQRYVSRLYGWRDGEVAAIDRQIVVLESSKMLSNNNLAGATRSAGIDGQIAALRSARAETVNSVQEQVVARGQSQVPE